MSDGQQMDTTNFTELGDEFIQDGGYGVEGVPSTFFNYAVQLE